jgi:hypothetical protein
MRAEEYPMGVRAMMAGLLAAALIFGAEKKPQTRSTENEDVEITATVFADQEAVRQVLGADLGGHYIVAQVQIAPKDGKKISISLDDFLLRTDKDGERTTPFTPSQIAGKGALVVSAGGGRGGSFGERGGPSWGGMPLGMPGGMIGGGGGSASGMADATMKSGAKEKENPLLGVLKEKILPEKETQVPVSGLLYFPMEKQKVKDLELLYKTPEGKLSLRFK